MFSLSPLTGSSERPASDVWPWYVQIGASLLALGVILGAQIGPGDRAASGGSSAVVQAGTPLLPPDGEQIYNTRCMSCHQMSGKGVPGTFPPLTGTDWVNGDKGRLIRLLLHGLSGRIEVNGQTYSGVMPPWGGALEDEGVAAVLTYVRTNFSNDTTAVTAEEVAKVRAATKGRSKPWTAKELKKPANQGIPGEEATAAGE